MPRLPDVAGQVSQAPQPSMGVAGYQPSNSLKELGADISGAGKDMEEASQLVAFTNQRQDTMNAQSAANQLALQSMQLQADPKTGFSQVKGGNAANTEFVKDYSQKFTDAQQAIRLALPNENQKRMFDQHAEITNLHFKGALLQHQATQTNAFNDATENDTMDLARRGIFQSPNDPSAMASGLSQINWAIDQKAKRLGWSEQVVSEVKSTYLGKVYEDVVGLEVERNPVSMLEVLNKRIGANGKAPEQTGVVAVDSLTPDKLITLRHRAAAYVASAAAHTKADQDKRLAEAKKSYEELDKFSLTGAMPSPAYEAQVKAATIGTIYEGPAKERLAAGMLGAAFGSQTLPRQQETLRALEATNAKGASPESLELHKRAEQIHENQTKAYKENPWDSWTEFGRGPKAGDQEMKQPGSAAKTVSERLKAQDALEGVTGFPVSPLKPKEAVEWAESLSALPPDQRATELGSVGAQLTAPRIHALAGQLDSKNRPLALALKLGSDQTTAGRNTSALVLRGVQAIADKTIKKDDSVITGWRSTISAKVRGALGDERMEDDVIDSAYYVRAAMENAGTAVGGFKLEASEDQALKLVIGLPLTRSGVKTILPRGMDEDQFDAKLRTYTPDVLRSLTTPPGMTMPGNIDLAKRPVVKNADGSISTVRSMGVNIGGDEVLIPTVSDDGRIMSDQEAVDTFKNTGRHLGRFKTPETSTAYALALHDSQASYYSNGGKGSPTPIGLFYVNGVPLTAESLSLNLNQYSMRLDGKGNYIPGRGNLFVTTDKAGTQPLRLKIQ